STWSPFGSGLPNAQVLEIEDLPSLQVLAVGTHGRGMYEISDAPLGGLSISNPGATESTGFSGPTIATFTDSPTGINEFAFTATVTWGDGTTTTLSGAAGNIVPAGNGQFALISGHTYAEEGPLTLSVKVSDSSANTISGSLAIS